MSTSMFARVCVWACAWEDACECEGVCLWGSVIAYLSGIVHSVGGYT